MIAVLKFNQQEDGVAEGTAKQTALILVIMEFTTDDNNFCFRNLINQAMFIINAS